MSFNPEPAATVAVGSRLNDEDVHNVRLVPLTLHIHFQKRLGQDAATIEAMNQ